ncbi:MAG: phospholipase [Bacteroidales bacterium]|nr:phospholipase [Bacteroidales bacterium]
MEKFLIIIFLALAALGIFSYLAGKYHWFERPSADEEPSADAAPDESEVCCGQHLVCQKDRAAMAQTEIVYYNDEELDAYRGIPSDGYDDKGLAEFSEVFYTLQPDDMMGWLNSLRLRGIELPDPLRDEALMIVSERRNAVQ